mgnify:CR=1 FL=1
MQPVAAECIRCTQILFGASKRQALTRAGDITVFKMNYERVIAYDFPRSGVTPLYNGSSINRRHNDAKKIERRKKEAEILGKNVHGNGEDRLLFSVAAGELITEARAKLSKKQPAHKKGDKYTLSRASGRKIRNKCAAFFHAGARAFVTLTLLQLPPLTPEQATKKPWIV